MKNEIILGIIFFLILSVYGCSGNTENNTGNKPEKSAQAKQTSSPFLNALKNLHKKKLRLSQYVHGTFKITPVVIDKDTSGIDRGFTENIAIISINPNELDPITADNILLANDSLILLSNPMKEANAVWIISVLPDGTAKQALLGKYHFGNTNFHIERNFEFRPEGQIVIRDTYKSYDEEADKFINTDSSKTVFTIGKDGKFRQIK